MENKLGKILGTTELLLGAGFLISPILKPELKSWIIPLVLGGSYLIFDATTDLISGRMTSLAEKVEIVIDYFHKEENEKINVEDLIVSQRKKYENKLNNFYEKYCEVKN